MVTNYIPDFSIDLETRAAFSRSANPNNPAVKITLASGDSVVYSHWAFFNFPGQHSGSGPYKVNAVSYEPQFYTGLQIRDNPGVPLVWTGIILMTLGIFAVFYVSRKKVWVVIEPRSGNAGTSRITIGGTSSSAQQDFQHDFEKLCDRIKETFQGES
jgi:cytochrome c biogenesis protein